MKKLVLILALLLIATNCYADWESEGGVNKQPVDLMPLDLGFYVSNNLVTSTPQPLPNYNFTGRHTMTIFNRDAGSSIFLVTDSTSLWSNGFEIPTQLSLSIDIGDSATDSVIYAVTSGATISVSAHTIELR